MNKIIYNLSVLAAILFFSCKNGFSQIGFDPIKLSKGVNSEYSEINPVISPEGKILYFSRINHPANTFGKWDSQDIWYSTLNEDGTWSEAQRMPDYLNAGRYNALFSVFNAGNSLLINGVFYKDGKLFKSNGLSVSHKIDDKWSYAKKIYVKGLNFKGRYINAHMSGDGKYLFLAYGGGNKRNMDIYVSSQIKADQYAKPVKLKNVNNKKTSEEAPYLSPDGNTLYFSSERSGSKGYDLYVSRRVGVDNSLQNPDKKLPTINSDITEWEEPVPLRENINSFGWESYLSTTSNGTIGYFSSTKDDLKNADIFVVKLFEDRPYIAVKGKLLNGKSGEPLRDKKFTIYVNNVKMDKVEYFNDSIHYKFNLPFGKKYEVTARLDHYNSITEVIDATNYKEYTEMKKDLKVEPLPYVLVRGTFMNQSNNQLVPFSANPKIMVDGQPISPSKIDVKTGIFEFLLDYGKKYKLEMIADNFDTVPVNLDLNRYKEYTEVYQNLFATPAVYEID
jgi:hypothetical protein